MPEWTANLGEQPMHITIQANEYSNVNDIVVTCEQTWFVLTQHGQIRYQRRLEYSPSCLMTYHLDKMYGDIYEDESRTQDDVLMQVKNEEKLTTPCFMTVLGSFE